MATFSLARLHERAVSHAKNLAGKLGRHEELLETLVMEAVRTGETASGGAAAALVDHYMGPQGVDLPEAMIGPAPVVLTAAFVLKGAAFVLGKGKAAPHLHAFANGVGAAGAYATLLRTLKAHAAAAPAKAA